jgi:hypothetical protein
VCLQDLQDIRIGARRYLFAKKLANRMANTIALTAAYMRSLWSENPTIPKKTRQTGVATRTRIPQAALVQILRYAR